MDYSQVGKVVLAASNGHVVAEPGLEIESGPVNDPAALVIVGNPGSGKSTWAAGAPGVVFIDLEAGTKRLNVKRSLVPGTKRGPRSYKELTDMLTMLLDKPHAYKTVVIDTINEAEKLMTHDVTKSETMTVTEYNQNHYGGGTRGVISRTHQVLRTLNKLRDLRGMGVILIAHSKIKNEVTGDLTKHETNTMDMEVNGAATLVRSWADGVYFADQEAETSVTADKKGRAFYTGERYLYTKMSGVRIGKDRYHLAERLPLRYEYFAEGERRFYENKEIIEGLVASMHDLASRIVAITGDVSLFEKVDDRIKRRAGDVAVLSQDLNELQIKLAGIQPVVEPTQEKEEGTP